MAITSELLFYEVYPMPISVLLRTVDFYSHEGSSVTNKQSLIIHTEISVLSVGSL